MAQRAPDVQELEDLLNNTATDKEMCDKAIEICRRLQLDILLARHGRNTRSLSDLEAERLDFESVMREIWERRSKDVLNDYITHTQTYGGPLDG